MPKTVFLINQYASTPDTGIGGRHFYLAEELARLGHNVYVIAASAHHLLANAPVVDGDFKVEEVAGFKFVWINMPSYAGAHSIQRIINWFLFSFRLQRVSGIIKEKPSAVLCSSPSLISFLGAERLAKKNNAKLIFEVRDIWPLTLVKVGGHSPWHPLIRVMQWVENRAYKKADAVVSNLKNAAVHMCHHGLDKRKFVWIPNGFSNAEVSKGVRLNSSVSAKIPAGKFIVGYAGTLGFANALDVLIEAAALLKEYSDIEFVLAGRGKEQEALHALALERGLENVSFVGSVPKIEIQSLLSLFDVCFIGCLKDDLYQFGIGANKIPEYFYSGKPVIHAYSGACDPVAEFGAGLVVEAQNSQAIADAVLAIYKMPPEERAAMGGNGRKAAIEQYEYGRLAKKLENVLFGE